MNEDKARALIESFAAANRAVAWAEAGGDDADDHDVEALKESEAALLAALVATSPGTSTTT